MNKKLIFIENEFHAKEYLKNKEKFKGFTPITFNFLAEQLLEKNNIKFKLEEVYEKENMYKGVCSSSIKNAKEIIKQFPIMYKNIELMSLFFYELYILFSSSKRNLILFKEIIKKEKPKEMLAFEAKNKFFEREFGSTIIPNIFKGKIQKIKYDFPKQKSSKKEKLIKIFMFVQQILAKILLRLAKNKNKIFALGGEQYYKKVLESLAKKNKIISFSHSIGKSFFASNTFVPHYEFKGMKILGNKKFKKELEKFIKIIEDSKLNKTIGMEKEIEKRVKIYLKQLIKYRFIESCEKINEVLGVLKKQNIKLFLSSADSDPSNLIISRVAKVFGVPTIGFQHGLAPVPEMDKISESDYFLVYGPKIKKEYLKGDYSKKKIEIIGFPKCDCFKNENKKNTKKIIYAMEIGSGNRSLTPEIQLTKRKQKIILRRIFNVLKKFPDYKLIIKTRVKWDMKGLPEVIAKEEGFKNFQVIEKTNNNDLINDCDVFLMNQTTMGLEALILNKPVISVSFKEYDKINPYRKIKGVPITNTEKQLEEAIKKAINETEQDVLVRRESLNKFMPTDGKASERAFKIIEEILNEKNLNKFVEL